MFDNIFLSTRAQLARDTARLQINNMPSNSRCQKVQSHLNNFPILVDISLPHWPQKMTGTLQMPPTTDVFQVNAKFVTAARSQAINLVQPEPKLPVQIAEALSVVIPRVEEIYSAVISLLKPRLFSPSRRLITEDFKFTQTIRIDVIHSTHLVASLVNFEAALRGYKTDNSILCNWDCNLTEFKWELGNKFCY